MDGSVYLIITTILLYMTAYNLSFC